MGRGGKHAFVGWNVYSLNKQIAFQLSVLDIAYIITALPFPGLFNARWKQISEVTISNSNIGYNSKFEFLNFL